MNPLLKHMVFTVFKRKTEKECRKKIVGSELWGDLVSITFIVLPEKIIQRVKFDNYEGDVELTADERKYFLGALKIDIDKELKECKNILCSIDCSLKTIFVKYNYLNGTFKNLSI